MSRTLFKIYFWLIAIPVFAVATILTAIVVIVGCLFGFERFFSYYPGMLWSRTACILSLCPVRIKGREHIQKGRSYIFVSNHQGAFDIFLIYGYLGTPIKWMMKKGIARIPFVGFACRMAGFVFVDKTTARAAHKSVEEAKNKLNHGRSLLIFPEGSRTSNGQLGRFKKGAYQIAVEQRLPIIPITLNGPYKILPAGSLLVRPNRMEMTIHPPILPHENENDEKEALQTLVEATRDIIHTALWDEFK